MDFMYIYTVWIIFAERGRSYRGMPQVRHTYLTMGNQTTIKKAYINFNVDGIVGRIIRVQRKKISVLRQLHTNSNIILTLVWLHPEAVNVNTYCLV
jgi:hypothetical protein